MAKSKTGCVTCRSRRVKCDERKPSCQKCVSTGRVCDGYKSVFRIVAGPINHNLISDKAGLGLSPSQITAFQPTNKHTPDIQGVPEVRSTQSTFVSTEDIELLNRLFSTKTLFDVKLDCNEEALHALQASKTDPSLQHAIASLRTLRENLETSGDDRDSLKQHNPSHQVGLQQYNTALRGLAFNLSSPSSAVLKSALLCCQIFISIEQVRKNYAALSQHVIRGLGIMHEYRARPYLDAANRLVPAHHDRLPLLDVFIIKLFVAPCEFADPPVEDDSSEASSMTLCQQVSDRCPLRTIAPQKRTELTEIATSTLKFLDKASQVKSIETARQALSHRATLLDALESWLEGLNCLHPGVETELISVSFLRMFHLILKIVLLGVLESSADLDAKLRIENEKLQDIARLVGERVRDYVTCSGSRGRG